MRLRFIILFLGVSLLYSSCMEELSGVTPNSNGITVLELGKGWKARKRNFLDVTGNPDGTLNLFSADYDVYPHDSTVINRHLLNVDGSLLMTQSFVGEVVTNTFDLDLEEYTFRVSGTIDPFEIGRSLVINEHSSMILSFNRTKTLPEGPESETISYIALYDYDLNLISTFILNIGQEFFSPDNLVPTSDGGFLVADQTGFEEYVILKFDENLEMDFVKSTQGARFNWVVEQEGDIYMVLEDFDHYLGYRLDGENLIPLNEFQVTYENNGGFFSDYFVQFHAVGSGIIGVSNVGRAHIFDNTFRERSNTILNTLGDPQHVVNGSKEFNLKTIGDKAYFVGYINFWNSSSGFDPILGTGNYSESGRHNSRGHNMNYQLSGALFQVDDDGGMILFLPIVTSETASEVLLLRTDPSFELSFTE